MNGYDFFDAGWRAYHAGWCHYLRGQSAKVLACADRDATHWETARAGARERATAILLRGIGHETAQDYPAAISAEREALALWRSLSPNSADVSIGLCQLAGTLKSSRQFDEAEAHYREALSIAIALPDPEGVVVLTGNLAELALAREEWPNASPAKP